VAKFPLGDFLASLGKGGAAGEPSEAALDVPCPSCGATLRDFRQTGRLGCAVCYDAFEGHLRDLLRRLHGSTHHEGETYRPQGLGVPPSSTAAPRHSPLDELKAKLKRAVETENFELAAELRDRIRVLE
jgi:protein arginine kinase activator